MKAAVVKDKGLVEIEEIPKPQPASGMLLLKVLYCSICGADVQRVYSTNWDIATPEQLKYMRGAILGHEYVGAVEAIGEGVTGWKVGDRVVDVHIACGNCWYCRRGMSDLCMGGRVRGYPYDGKTPATPDSNRGGAMAEFILRPAKSRLRVPTSVSDKEAAMTEPLATGVTSAIHAGVGLGDSVAIIGLGHIGLMVLAAARAAGAAPLIAIDLKEDRLKVAKKMGANVIINAGKTDVINDVVNITEAGPDIVFVCTSFNARGVVEQAFEMARYHGRVMIVGNAAPATLDAGKWFVKEVRVEGTAHMGEAMIKAMALIENKRVDVKPVITEVIPLEETQRAFESLHNFTNIAVLLKP